MLLTEKKTKLVYAERVHRLVTEGVSVSVTFILACDLADLDR